MSAPYVYTPDAAYQPGPYGSNAAYTPFSPFIPDASFRASPYSQPGSLHPSPNLGTSGLPPIFPPNVDEIWYRQRRPSWHGPAPIIDQQGFLSTGPQTHGRSNSYGQQPFFPPPASAPVQMGPGYSPWNQPMPLPTDPTWEIHPLLDGARTARDRSFSLDLSLPTFTPLYITGPNGQRAHVPVEVLAQPATKPYIYELKVVSDKIPQWPIYMSYIGGSAGTSPNNYTGFSPTGAPGNAPPISVGDVLSEIHRVLHWRITQADDNDLSSRQKARVYEAFWRRIKLLGPAHEHGLRMQGVHRIDHFGRKVWFGGLVKDGKSLNKLTLITGED